MMDIGDLHIIHRHIDRWPIFPLPYVLHYTVVFSQPQQAIIETLRLYDHIVLTEKYETILLRDLYKKTLKRPFKTPIHRTKFREQLDEAVKKLKAYLAHNVAPNPDRIIKI